jgi:hypothetical protein
MNTDNRYANTAAANAPASVDLRSPHEIAREIDATRSRIESTLAAIRRDLSSASLIDGLVRSGTAGQFAHGLGQNVKRHPMPAALAGLGLAWMAMAEHHDRSSSTEAGHPRLDAMRAKGAHAKQRAGAATHDLIETLKEHPMALGGLGLAIGALLGGAAPRTQTEDEMLGSLSDAARERMHEKAREGVERASSRIEQNAQRQSSASAGDGAADPWNAARPH